MLEYFLLFVLLTNVLSASFEWTALGDSYASGVGSGDYVNGRRCLRYDQAYPVVLNADPNLSTKAHIFNNVACSGASSQEVQDYQFYDTDMTNQPNWQYSPRPKFGDPVMATLSVGGNDIDFRGILFNCILETTLWGGKSTKPCDEQRQDTHNLLNSADLVNSIDSLIKKTVARGRAGTVGDAFRLYVTGFPEFFNQDDHGCDTVTFARTANPKLDGKDHIMMTTDLRKDYNSMSVDLNTAIQRAVSLNEDQNVKFIDIQANGLLDGHRFCEPGVVEPDQSNQNLWIWHYPYKQNDDANPPAALQVLLDANNQITQGLDLLALSLKFPTIAAYEDALWDAVDEGTIDAQSGDPINEDVWNGWSDFIGWRAKLFHPQVAYHSAIKDLVLNQFLEDTQPNPAVGSGPCVPVGNRFDPQTLRILPLGASIVYGSDSSDGNGFRENLRSQLIANGASVNYVGEVQAGTMIDNDVSGFPGLRIEQVAPLMEHALPWLPNLILIHLGTNDALQNFEVSTAADRLGAILDRITSALPHTVALVSTLIPNLNGAAEANIEIINAMLPGLVQKRANQGALIYLADMHTGYITDADITQSDGTHPTDAGYVKMANVWYSAIQQVYTKCWITPPGFVATVNDTVTTGIVDTTCEKVVGNTIGPIKTQQGSGIDDGVYVHSANVLGQANIGIPNNAVDFEIEQVYWADIDGDGTKLSLGETRGQTNNATGIDDFVYLYGKSPALGVALSDGSGANGFAGAGGYLKYTIDMPCSPAGIPWFGDIDGDGRDDFICIAGDNGALTAWRNTPGRDPRQPNWIPLGVLWTPPHITASQGYLVLLGDIDGDGKVDYMTISDTDGSITAWRNGGVGVPTFWQSLGVVFNEGGGLKWTQFRFADINGDGRSDVLWVSDTGAVTTWTNLRGETLNILVPLWKYAGVTHSGGGTGVTQYFQVQFGDVAGHKEWTTYPDYNGVGDDYTVLYSGTGGATPLPPGETSSEDLVVKLWFNTGNGGGTRQKGDGDRYCDMRGTGSDDYVWMAKDGTLTLYGNYHDPPYWLQYGTIYTPGVLMSGHTRKDVFLADLDGDGRCDFLIVDKDSGSVHMIRNDYSSATDKFAWTDVGIVFDGGGCPNHHGVGLFDLAVRFADVTGNGYPDYLCIDPDGRTTAWINTGLNFESLGQIKFSVGADRANVRFVDINGDGRADYLWVDKFAGSYQVWTNEGPGDPAANSGSHIHWTPRGLSGGGGDLRGECINWSDLNGDGRADYTVVYPQTSLAYVYWNVCPDGGHPPPMTILPPLPGDPYQKRSIENETQHPHRGSRPPRRPLVRLDDMAESWSFASG